MSAYSPRRSTGPVLRSTSPPGRANRHAPSSSFASATSSAFSTTNSFRKPTTSPARVNLFNYTSSSLSFSLDRTGSPNRSFSVVENRSFSVSTTVEKPPAAAQKRTCMCSPTNHPGSFRCSLHKNGVSSTRSQTASYGSSTRLNMVRSAMKNSLVRIGTVEGDLVKRALAALIRPSSHQQRRRGEFLRLPSRLSVMSES